MVTNKLKVLLTFQYVMMQQKMLCKQLKFPLKGYSLLIRNVDEYNICWRFFSNSRSEYVYSSYIKLRN